MKPIIYLVWHQMMCLCFSSVSQSIFRCRLLVLVLFLVVSIFNAEKYMNDGCFMQLKLYIAANIRQNKYWSAFNFIELNEFIFHVEIKFSILVWFCVIFLHFFAYFVEPFKSKLMKIHIKPKINHYKALKERKHNINKSMLKTWHSYWKLILYGKKTSKQKPSL